MNRQQFAAWAFIAPALAVIALLSGPGRAIADRPAVGAIRWDAWYGHESGPGRDVVRALSTPRFLGRLPFFAELDPVGRPQLPGYTSQVMGAEIQAAVAAGLDFWAFVLYRPESEMSRGLAAFLAHPQSSRLRFCVISEVQRWHPTTIPADTGRVADLMARPNYHRTPSGRPILFLLAQNPAPAERTWRHSGGLAGLVEAIRNAAKARNLPNPYVVFMAPRATDAAALADRARGDAVSAYAVHPASGRGSYAALANHAERHWNAMRSTKCQVIPLAMVGWDRRPRAERPVSWETNRGQMADPTRYFEKPTADQLASHISKALRWVRAHPESSDADSVLIYSWNEHDEGGAICPNLGDWDAMVRALRPVLVLPAEKP